MAITYENISSFTATSTVSDITFNSIPQTYTDLIVVFEGTCSGSPDLDIGFRFNGDSGNNYSNTCLRSSGSTVDSFREANRPIMRIGVITATRTAFKAHIFNYTNTAKQKTVLSKQDSINTSYGMIISSGLWRNTNAINSIIIRNQEGWGNFQPGSVATIYGVLKG